jgi:quercetin dioxygenase-like cupin family protein
MRLLTLWIALILLAAQSPPAVETTAEPHHHLILSNDQVRVFFVDVPPHSETLLHRHRHDYIYVTLGSAEVINAVEGQAPVTLKLANGETRFTPGNFAHIARNSSDQPFRNVTIEILGDARLRQSPAQQDPAHHDPARPEEDRGLEILPGGTQEILWIHDGIRASEFELQPGGMVPAHHAGAQLFVAVSDLDLRSSVPLKSALPVALPAHFKPGEVQWLVAGDAPTLTNTGHAVARFVTLEFP